MQKLIELAKDQPRVFVRLKTPHEKAQFLKQAAEEGFMLGKKLPTECECDDVMIIHDDYSMCYCAGMTTNWLLHSKQSVVVDYASIM